MNRAQTYSAAELASLHRNLRKLHGAILKKKSFLENYADVFKMKPRLVNARLKKCRKLISCINEILLIQPKEF